MVINSVPAPDIPPDLEWIAAGDIGRSLADWRGRPLLLDFWTRSCVNCVHAAAEVDELVARFGDRLAVIGVHSPKFIAERDLAVVRAGAAQLGFDHPMVNDPDLRLWRLYGVQAWPTVVLVGPAGELVATAVGESEIAGLAAHIEGLDSSSAAPRKRDGASPVTRPQPGPRPLRFPNRILVVDDGRLVSEQCGDVVLVSRSGSVQRRYKGFGDPMGMCAMPDGRIAVADAGRHQVVALDRHSGALSIVAGSGVRGDRRVRSGVSASAADLASPHDVAWWQGGLCIALAGQHQIVRVSGGDPSGTIELVAGSSAEGLKDGSPSRARLAMPTALATTVDDGRLWFVDADSSSLRWVEGGLVSTAVGHSVTTCGHRDGAPSDALLQHPSGIAIDEQGRVLVADVFNGALRRFDPVANRVETLSIGLAEPTDVAVVDGAVVVVQRSGSVVGPVSTDARDVNGWSDEFFFSPTTVQQELKLDFVGEGQAEIEVGCDPPELLVSCIPTESGVLVRLATGILTARNVTTVLDRGQGSLDVVVTRSECEHVCSVLRQRWIIPVVIDPAGTDTIPLIGR